MKVARLGDRTQGTCSCHLVPINVGGSITTASPDVFANGIAVARIGDTVLADCGHTGTIVSASPDVYANVKKIARVGDQTEGCYVAVIIAGSPNVYAND